MLGSSRTKKRGLRDPERTRERLLQAGFREVHRSGFQSASIDTILAATNVTKGALYYHFESKEDLGHAIVEEIIAKLPRDRWLLPLHEQGQDPIDALIGIVRPIPARPEDVKGRLSPGQFGAGDVSARRTIPQAIGEHLPCLARRDCHGFAERTVSGNSPARLGCVRDCRLSDRDGRRLPSVGKECSRSEGVEWGNQKYRGMAEVSSRTSSIAQSGETASDVKGTGC